MKTYNKNISAILISILLAAAIVIIPNKHITAAEATVDLGSTVNFAVLAGTTITNTGSTTIDGVFGGDIGLHPGSSIIGFPPGIVGGIVHLTDSVAEIAKVDLIDAYDDAASRSVTQDLSGIDLGGLTLTTGVYFFSSSAQLTGVLTLDAQGDPNAVFIFQIGSALNTASGSEVRLINSARFCRVFWQVVSSATLGTDSSFAGHIFALSSITVTTGATVEGQLLARNGAVTLDSNVITNGLCETITPTPTPSPPASSSASESGGVLPDTSTPWTTVLFAGVVLAIISSMVLVIRRNRE